jgi:hypothetical protein
MSSWLRQGRVPNVRALRVLAGIALHLALSMKVFPAVGGGDELPGSCGEQGLPADVRSSLGRLFSGWKIQEPTDLTPKARESWAAEKPLACPGIATGHFENPKKSSYALLLVAADGAKFQLLVFTQQGDQPLYGSTLVDQLNGSASDVFVRTVPTAQYFGEQSKWSLRSRRPVDSVLLVKAGPSAPQEVVYVWTPEGQSYQRQPVSP